MGIVVRDLCLADTQLGEPVIQSEQEERFNRTGCGKREYAGRQRGAPGTSLPAPHLASPRRPVAWGLPVARTTILRLPGLCRRRSRPWLFRRAVTLRCSCAAGMRLPQRCRRRPRRVGAQGSVVSDIPTTPHPGRAASGLGNELHVVILDVLLELQGALLDDRLPSTNLYGSTSCRAPAREVRRADRIRRVADDDREALLRA